MYRIITNGKKFQIQKKAKVGHLWWKHDDWLTLGALIPPNHIAIEFDTKEAAQKKIDSLIKEQNEKLLPWEPVD